MCDNTETDAYCVNMIKRDSRCGMFSVKCFNGITLTIVLEFYLLSTEVYNYE